LVSAHGHSADKSSVIALTWPAVASVLCLTVLGLKAIDLVSDPPIPPPTPSRGAEPSSESAAFVTPDPLLGTVFLTTSIRSMTLAFLSAV